MLNDINTIADQRKEYLEQYKKDLVKSGEFPEWVIKSMVGMMRDYLVSYGKVRP